MSTSTFENGNITLNSAGYSSVIRAMREVKNNQADYMYKVSLDLYSKLGPKGTHAKAVDMANVDENDVYTYDKMPISGNLNLTENSYFYILKELFRGKNNKILKPRKSGFPYLTNRDSSFELIANGAIITFDGQHKTVSWYVGEGNNSVSCAHADCLSKSLISLLDSRKWGKGEGGSFHMWDEYMNDGEDAYECEDERRTEPTYAWGNSSFVGKVRKSSSRQNSFSGHFRY